MLKKSYRLRKNKEIKKVIENGLSVFNKEIGIKFIKNNLLNSRFCFIVSSKIDKRATVRNKIKRRLREIIRQNLEKIKPGFDIVIFAKVGIKDLDFFQLKEKLEQLLKKSKLFKAVDNFS
jgi:ribonuclease P protein component